MFISQLDWAYGFGGGRPHGQSDILNISYHTKGTCYHQHDLSLMMQTLIIRPMQCLLGFSTNKLYFLLPHSPLWKQVPKCSPHSRGGELSATFLRGDYLCKLFGILCRGDFSFFPHFFIYSDIYLHQQGFMGIYFMY